MPIWLWKCRQIGRTLFLTPVWRIYEEQASFARCWIPSVRTNTLRPHRRDRTSHSDEIYNVLLEATLNSIRLSLGSFQQITFQNVLVFIWHHVKTLFPVLTVKSYSISPSSIFYFKLRSQINLVSTLFLSNSIIIPLKLTLYRMIKRFFWIS